MVQQDERPGLAAGAETEALRRRVRELEAQALEHERTRRKLREESSFRTAVIERAAEGVCVCHAVAEHPFVRFTVWNRRMTEITGYTMDEINRLGWYQTMYPDPAVSERAQRRMAAMREGEDLRGEDWEVRRADGRARVLRIATSVLVTDDGLAHVLGLMVDATDEVLDRRRLETKVTVLEGLLPTCSSCKAIRDESGQWQPIEEYISRRSGVEFTHGLCPACAHELYPEEE